jgi:hypothetical protein
MVEGFIRNLVDNPEFLLLKDVAIVAIYIRVIHIRWSRGERMIPAQTIGLPLLALTIVAGVESLNPQLVNPLQPLVGIRTWLFYIPLYIVGLELFSTPRARRWLVVFLLAASVPICALAALQFILGPAAYGSLGPGFHQATFVTGIDGARGAVFRPNATFSFPNHFALFLATVTLLSLIPLLGSRGWRFAGMTVVFGFLLAMNLIENQRLVIVLLPLLFAFVFWRRHAGRRPLAIFGAAAVALVLVQFVTSHQTGQFAILERTQALIVNGGNVFGTRGNTYLGTTWSSMVAAPFGLGTGASTNGSRYLFGGTGPLFIEFALAKVVTDLGIIGVCIYGWLFFALIRATMLGEGNHQLAGDTASANFAAVVVAIQVMAVVTGYDLGVVAVTLWLLSGAAAWPAGASPVGQASEPATAGNRMPGQSSIGVATVEPLKPGHKRPGKTPPGILHYR